MEGRMAKGWGEEVREGKRKEKKEGTGSGNRKGRRGVKRTGEEREGIIRKKEYLALNLYIWQL